MTGPVWIDRLYDPDVVKRLHGTLEDEECTKSLKMKDRVKALLGVVLEELPDVPFYYNMPSMIHVCCLSSWTTCVRTGLQSNFTLSRLGAECKLDTSFSNVRHSGFPRISCFPSSHQPKCVQDERAAGAGMGHPSLLGEAASG